MSSYFAGNKGRIFTILILFVAFSFLTLPGSAHAQSAISNAPGGYQQTNLVANGGTSAPVVDPNLGNPWGLVSSTAGPWWISDNTTGLSTLYNGQGQIVPLVVTVPNAPVTAGGTATGIVFSTSGFMVSQNGVSGASAFLFSTADGTISGWNPVVNRTNAIVTVKQPGAVYRGLALATNSSVGPALYAANFSARTVDMFDSTFHKVRSFTDPVAASCSSNGGGDGRIGAAPSKDSGKCFAPFGIQTIGNQIIVTFVLQNSSRQDDFGIAGNGNGFVDVFDTNGKLLRRLTSSSQLNAPWGVALAPANFGQFSNDLLIGNFGDGRINAFNPTTGALIGQLPVRIDGLWALQFGNGAAAGATNQLFFTAGPEHGRQGLFGFIQSA